VIDAEVPLRCPSQPAKERGRPESSLGLELGILEEKPHDLNGAFCVVYRHRKILTIVVHFKKLRMIESAIGTFSTHEATF
jgi:hypothetical protein